MISVVIICRNAVRTIGDTLQSALCLTDDVVVIDTGSTDGTLEQIQPCPVRLYQKAWMGYGATKNLGNRLAKYSWILSVDADEAPGKELIDTIRQLSLQDEATVYNVQRLSYLGNKAIRFGGWGRSYIPRLFNRNFARWDHSEVHEELKFDGNANPVRLTGTLHHYTSPDIQSYRLKLNHYASLMADKYLAKGKQGGYIKSLFSPTVNFARNYILKAGFLDGKEGWQIAKAMAGYTFQKYRLLQQKQKFRQHSFKMIVQNSGSY